MRKNITSLLALAVVFSTAGLASCKKDSGDITIEFWTRDGTADYYANIVAAFESAYPNITVNVEDNGDYGPLDQKISQGLTAGNLPDIAITYPDYVAGYLKTAPNRVVDMTPYMNDSEIGFGRNDPEVEWDGEKVQVHTDADDMVQAYIDEGRNFSTEGQFELPLSKSTEMLFVNIPELTQVAQANNMTYDDIREKLSTWEGLWEVVDMMKKALPEKYTGAPAESNNATAPLVYEDDTNFLITLTQQLGIPYVDGSDPDNPVLFGLTDENVQAVTDLVKKLGALYDSGSFVTGSTSGMTNEWYATSGFADQTSGMIITTTAGLHWLNNDKGPFFDIDVLPMPSSATDWVHDGKELPATAIPNAVISQGPGVTFFNLGDEDRIEAAWLFYKTMTSDFLNAQWVAAGDYAPVRASVYDTDIFNSMFDLPEEETENWEYEYKLRPAKKLMYDVIDTYDVDDRLFTTDVFPGSGQVRTDFGNILPGTVLLDDNQSEEAIKGIIATYFGQALENLQ